MTDAILSLIRTYVPLAVGALVSWLIAVGIELDADSQKGLIVALTGLSQALYYGLVRWMESRWSSAGVLLGSRKQPTYETPEITSAR